MGTWDDKPDVKPRRAGRHRKGKGRHQKSCAAAMLALAAAMTAGVLLGLVAVTALIAL